MRLLEEKVRSLNLCSKPFHVNMIDYGALAKKAKGTKAQGSGRKEQGLLRDLNPGPLAPEARIMPLDHAANETYGLSLKFGAHEPKVKMTRASGTLFLNTKAT